MNHAKCKMSGLSEISDKIYILVILGFKESGFSKTFNVNI